jgi:hypothetical protein
MKGPWEFDGRLKERGKGPKGIESLTTRAIDLALNPLPLARKQPRPKTPCV